MYYTGSQIIFKTERFRSSLCNYSNAYIPAKRTIKVPNKGAVAPQNNRHENVKFKNCASFTDCVSEINNTEIDQAKHIDVIMSMDNLIEHSDNYLQTSGSLQQYYTDEQAKNNNSLIIDFLDDAESALFKFKEKVTGQTKNDGTKDIQIMVPFKYLKSFWKTFEMALIKCEIYHFFLN